MCGSYIAFALLGKEAILSACHILSSFISANIILGYIATVVPDHDSHFYEQHASRMHARKP